MMIAAADGGGQAVQLPTAVTGSETTPTVDTGFATEAAGTDPQWTLDTDLARLSSDVYHGPGEPVGDGKWTRVDADVLAEAGILDSPRSGGEDDVVLNDPSTGLKAAMYTDGEGHVVVAFAGTDVGPIDTQDVITDVQQGIGAGAKQYDQAIVLGRKAVEAFGEGNVVFTGHSLGGGLASTASLATGNPAVTFNAAGIGATTWRSLDISHADAFADAIGGQIRRYNVENDVLTNAQQKTLVGPHGFAVDLPAAVGYEITLENPRGVEDPLHAHSSGTVVEAMEKQDIKSQQDDNVLEILLDRNIFPMGPSWSDLFETGGDAGRFIAETSGEAFDAAGVLIDDAMDRGRDLYAQGSEMYQDGIEHGREFVDDSLQTLDAAKDAGTEFIGDRVDDVGGVVSSGLDKATFWNN